MLSKDLNQKLDKASKAREAYKNTKANKQVAQLLCGKFYINYKVNK